MLAGPVVRSSAWATVSITTLLHTTPECSDQAYAPADDGFP